MLVWVGLYWAVVTVFSLVGAGTVTGEAAGYAAFWTAVVALWMWRVWCGGRMAVHYLRQVLLAFGVLVPGGVLLAVLVVATGFELGGDWPTLRLVLLTLPMIAFGAVSFVLSRLLRRPAVIEWTRAMGARQRSA
ncbi:hypothetical protein [Actinomadura sp. WMMA1423]|uniref:hypothetical protein n=1 Tax=Actinomadura sp. WMMA1423 TaxID=2591108 RepID=UPI001147A2C1|nr:hypothetical protein [Actinomadura sp. WMMA1423]